MSYWSPAPQPREQLVLFETRLEDALPPDHAVRLLDEILGQLDWSTWEATYHGRRGQPPIHPRVLSGVLLYGLLKRLRSSRVLEEALAMRLDFRWLAEGRTIDHTTLSEFRRRHSGALQDLFVQVGLVARRLGLLPLEQLAFDGTRLRANNRRSGTRTLAELRELRSTLEQEYAERNARIEAEDASPAGTSASSLPEELSDTKRRLAQVEAALAELDRIEKACETVPSRLPLTDPQSRVTPNKEGGFAPNYTPLVTVDTRCGLIVASEVIAMMDEEHHVLSQLEQVEQDFGLSAPVAELLADGKMSSGANLQAFDQRGTTLYSPTTTRDPQKNPALRDDPTQSVAAEHWDRLPTKSATNNARQKRSQLTKEAFVYDPQRDCYWCPLAQPLRLEQTTSEPCGKTRQVRKRYKAQATMCGSCVLRERCLQVGAKRREISRYEHDGLVEQLAQRMATPAAQATYARRREVAERPFAVIKQQFGARRFLLRGLAQVRIEWRWLTLAFNLTCLMSHLRSRDGPATVGSS